MPPRPLRIVLTGFSGTGKSIIVPLIAEKLRWHRIDTDVSSFEGQAFSLAEACDGNKKTSNSI